MSDKKHLATVTILLKDRQTHAEEVNKILSGFSHHIMARLGVNVQRSCVENCTAMITVAIEATAPELRELTKKLDALYGVVAKSSIMTD